MERGKRLYGEPPRGCDRCPMRCYVELSLLVKNPRSLLRETTGYLAETLGKISASPRRPSAA